MGDNPIKSGPVPKIRRNWRKLKTKSLTKGELVCRFAETYMRVPDGPYVGKSLTLDPFQISFILSVVDNPDQTRTAVLSMARRNGKTFIIAVLALAYLVGPLSVPNTIVASAAHSREQAALIFRFMEQIIMFSPELQAVSRIVPSSKRIFGLKRNTEFNALSADAKTGFGRSLRVVILDESGQFIGDHHPYIDMLRTSQGSYEDAVFYTISTQAPSDGDWLSIVIDDAVREQDPHTVVHLYEAEKGCDLMDDRQWHRANPGLGRFRSVFDLRVQLERASRLPSQSAGARNLLLNQRVASVSMWLSPDVWVKNNTAPDLKVFQSGAPVALGLDLSSRNDLTAAVLAAQAPDTTVHLWPFAFTPLDGLRARGERDRAPYERWVEEGHLIAVPGPTISYQWVAEYLALFLSTHNIAVTFLAFDRWRIEVFKEAAREARLAQLAEWLPVGQGYKDMSPRLEDFEALLLSHRVAHGSHPLLNLGAGGAIAIADPAKNRKLEKAKSTAKIDVLVAAVMASYQVSEGRVGQTPFDIAAIIG
jgi:phage terminase large subunit-like protein